MVKLDLSFGEIGLISLVAAALFQAVGSALWRVGEKWDAEGKPRDRVALLIGEAFLTVGLLLFVIAFFVLASWLLSHVASGGAPPEYRGPPEPPVPPL